LFLKAEELAANPHQTVEIAYEFLGLPRHRPQVARLNASPEYDDLPEDLRKSLDDYFRPHNERLYELIGVDFGWECDRQAVPTSAPTGE